MNQYCRRNFVSLLWITTASFLITSTASAECDVAVIPGVLQFEGIIGGSPHVELVPIHNDGTTDCVVSNVEVSGDASYSLDLPAPGPPYTLASNETIEFPVEFAPTNLGVFAATLVVTSNDPENILNAATLVGESGTCEIVALDTAIDFGIVPPGMVRTMTVRLRNPGSVMCSLLELSLSGDTSFELAPNTPSTPLLLGNRDIEIIYAPLTEGNHVATIDLVSQNPSQPVAQITIDGTSMVLCQMSRSPSQLEFGVVPFGKVSSLPVVISNIGEVDCVISELSTALDSPFSPDLDALSLPFTIPVNASQEILVNYRPDSEMVQTDQLAMIGNGNDLTVSLKGRGLAPGDSDGDGIQNSMDNCILLPNPNQIDSNQDGFGNRCDTDLNNDCASNSIDYVGLISQFLSNDPDADFNGDGIVNFTDIQIFVTFFIRPPGPSGLTAECD